LLIRRGKNIILADIPFLTMTKTKKFRKVNETDSDKFRKKPNKPVKGVQKPKYKLSVNDNLNDIDQWM
jgi:hypothetical protein